jgi:hypothetical protein
MTWTSKPVPTKALITLSVLSDLNERLDLRKAAEE